jgi:predicted transcriptional regulator
LTYAFSFSIIVKSTTHSRYYLFKRRIILAWDDDKKAQAISMYEEREPTPENSMDIVSEIAEELGESPNGVRMILSKAGVYVKKEAAAGGTKSKTTKTTSTRVSKEDAQAQLIAAIEAAGKEVDSDIISKLTGKAAVYFAGLFA